MDFSSKSKLRWTSGLFEQTFQKKIAELPLTVFPKPKYFSCPEI